MAKQKRKLIYKAHLDAEVAALPLAPGVYIFRDADNKPLYVGKAKSLRTRVRSYFAGNDERSKIPRLLAQVQTIEILLAGTELEALRLEDDLIKRHQPPFNVRLRDDKSYPYIVVTLADEYPRVMLTRDRNKQKGNRYFGPYASTKRVKETLDVLNKVFPYRPCEGPKPGRHSGTPCLDYHIKRCAAPCVAYISKEDYRAVIDEVIEYLGGNVAPVTRKIEEKMRQAAAEQRFEVAARFRDNIEALTQLSEQQTVEPRSMEDFDVLGVAQSETQASVQLLSFRQGRLRERRQFLLEAGVVDELGAMVEAVCLRHYEYTPVLPPLLVVPAGAEPSSALATLLTEAKGSTVEVRVARRGEKKGLVELATKNAALALEKKDAYENLRDERRAGALEELREKLNLEKLPNRIECYDISNLGSSSPVGAMTVFEGGVPLKAHYRHFGLDEVKGQDDFRMINEVLTRRLKHLSRGSDDPSFGATPDLIVIDGGKGQLAAGLAALKDSEVERVAIISLAKREEEIFLPGFTVGLRLPSYSAGLQVLQQIRDETHRFAIGLHRKRRDSRVLRSVFDELPGVGPKRKAALRAHFESAEKLRAATVEEIASVTGVGQAVAVKAHAFLHPVEETS